MEMRGPSRETKANTFCVSSPSSPGVSAVCWAKVKAAVYAGEPGRVPSSCSVWRRTPDIVVRDVRGVDAVHLHVGRPARLGPGAPRLRFPPQEEALFEVVGERANRARAMKSLSVVANEKGVLLLRSLGHFGRLAPMSLSALLSEAVLGSKRVCAAVSAGGYVHLGCFFVQCVISSWRACGALGCRQKRYRCVAMHGLKLRLQFYYEASPPTKLFDDP